MGEEVVISVNNVSKDFILLHERSGSVKGVFTSMFRKVTTKKETQHALKDISFEIKKGEFFGIVGRNGSGKSTLLKILAGIYQPTKGSVSTTGKIVPFIELGVGFNPELSGKDNVYLNGAILGFTKKQVEDMYKDIVEFAELERFMDQKLKNYSSGMQVRLAFSMAIRAKADILILDEVLAVGDAAFQRKCFEYFHKLKKNKTTVVFVSHDMEAIREYCDRVILIEKNVIVKEGSASKISQLYSRMFMEQKVDNNTTNKGNSDRWGNEKVKTSKATIIVNSETIAVEQTLIANSDTERPIIGIRIRDGSGKDITGTNTKIEETYCPNLKKGEHCTINWRFPNILSDGSYVIDLSIHEADGLTVSDWWDEAIKFSIQKIRHVPYSIAPNFNIEVSKD